MADITGIGIADVINCGAADNGQHVYVTCKLTNGEEKAIILPYETLGHFIALLQKTATTAYEARMAHNPTEAAEGIVSSVVPLKELSVLTSPDHKGVILQMLTADHVPISVEMPQDVARQLADGLLGALENIQSGSLPKSSIKRFH